jgi:hypothetical protein
MSSAMPCILPGPSPLVDLPLGFSLVHSPWKQVEQVAVAKHGSLDALSDLRAARVSGRLQQRADKRRREQVEQEQAEALRVRLEMEAAAAARDAAAAGHSAARQEPVGESVSTAATCLGDRCQSRGHRHRLRYCTLVQLLKPANCHPARAFCAA